MPWTQREDKATFPGLGLCFTHKSRWGKERFSPSDSQEGGCKRQPWHRLHRSPDLGLQVRRHELPGAREGPQLWMRSGLSSGQLCSLLNTQILALPMILKAYNSFFEILHFGAGDVVQQVKPP